MIPRKRNMRAVLGFIVLLAAVAPPSAGGLELRTAAQDSPPKYYRSASNRMAGLCVDIMDAIERLDNDIRFVGYQHFIPFARLQSQLECGQLDVFFGFKKTTHRSAKFTFLDVPLYRLNYVIAVRRKEARAVHNVDDIRRLPDGGIVLTVFGSAASNFLKNQDGVVVDDGAKSPQVLLRKLIQKRGRFAFYHDLGLQYAAAKEGLADAIRILPTSFSTYFHYAAFSRQVPEKTMEKVRSALERLQSSGELAIIHEKYFIQPFEY